MTMLSMIFSLVLLTLTAAQEGKECSSPPSEPTEELIGIQMESYSDKTVLKYNCRPGYIKPGTISYECVNGSWKKKNNIKCRKKSCGNPGEARFGKFRLTEGEDFSFGARVQYSCDDGYHMVSQRNFRVCMADGWSNDIPHCEVTTCEPVRQPEHGKIAMSSLYELDQEVPFGNVVQFECDEHYKITGEKEIHCKQDGTWSAAIPKCEIISCEVPDILHGRLLTVKPVFMENDDLDYECDRGYRYASRATATCTKLGWSPRPECTGITCEPPNLMFVTYINKKLIYQYGEEIAYRCLEQFKTEDNKNDGRATCDTLGWKPEISCLERSCDLPEAASGYIPEYYISYRNYYFKIGGTVPFKCNNGYESKRERYDTFSIMCTLEGWKPKPECLKICKFLQLDNVKDSWRISDTYKENRQVTYECEDGYFSPQKRSKETAKCLSSGWSVEPSCKKPCTFPDVLHGSPDTMRSLKDDFYLDEELSYQCDNDYITDDGMSKGKTKCLLSGWYPEPKCTKLTCTKPNIKQGQSKITNGLVEFSCKPGYILHGSKISQCHHIGWYPPPPLCQEYACGIPPEITFGMHLTEKDFYNIGENVTYRCEENYILYGQETITCTSEGWSTVPSCENSAIKCEHPTGVEVLSERSEEHEFGSTIIYKCSSPFQNMEFNKSTCIGGKWTPDIRCIDPEKKCEPPTNTSTAKIRQSSKSEYINGSTVIYECIKGMFPSGLKREIRTCIGGSWTALLECRGNKCPPPPPQLPNSEILNSSAEYYDLHRIQYICKPNYELEGSQVVTCFNGKWTPLPKCVYKKCPQPPLIRNGTYISGNNKYNSGDEVEYHCDEGYTLKEAVKVRCEFGKWSPVPECEAHKCKQPQKITNGQFEPTQWSYESGEKVTYTCHNNYILKGTAEVACVLGKWEDTPYCTAEGQSCSEPPRVNNGDTAGIVQPPYKDGVTVKYQCFTKYKREGDQYVQCQNGKWTKPPRCLEACTVPVEMMEKFNLELKFIDTQKLYAEHDEYIEFKCKRGFKKDPKLPMRAKCDNGHFPYPSCTKGSSY